MTLRKVVSAMSPIPFAIACGREPNDNSTNSVEDRLLHRGNRNFEAVWTLDTEDPDQTMVGQNGHARPDAPVPWRGRPMRRTFVVAPVATVLAVAGLYALMLHGYLELTAWLLVIAVL